MPTYHDEAIVLRTMRLGEADRIVTLLCAEHGKVRAVAKGVRRTKSRIGGRLEPLSHVAAMCWRGRELDVVNQVETLDSFRAVRDDLSRLGPASAMLEIADRIATEHAPCPEIFATLLGALRALEDADPSLVLSAFCLKVLASEGVGPIVEACARCSSVGPLVAFDITEGGLLCANCRRGVSVSPAFVAYAQLVLSGRVAAALRSGPEHSDEFERVALQAMEHHLDRRLRAGRHLAILERRTG